KSVDIFDLSDYRNDIAFSESVFRVELYRCLILSFQSDNIQLIVFPKSKFFNTLSARASGYTYLPDLYAVIQMDEVQKIIGNQTFPEEICHILFRIDNLCTDLFQNRSLFCTKRLGDHSWYSHLNDTKCC